MMQPPATDGHPARPLRLLVLAWGYSIHAERRVRLFAEDPDFEVALATTYDYGFAGVRQLLLHDAAFNPPPTAGAERTVAAADAAGPGRPRLVERLPVLRSCVAFAYECYRAIGDTRRLRRFAATYQPDLVIAQTLLYPGVLALALPRRCPLLITFWNGDILYWAQFKGFERMFKRSLVAAAARRARGITVNSATMKQRCLAYGARAERVHLLRYPGVDDECFFPRDRDVARATLGIDAQQVIFCPRGLGGYLNADIILAAAALVAQSHPDSLFLFASGAGGAGELARHRQLAAGLGISEQVRFLGQLPWREMADCYAAADVMVSMASEDSLPNCLLEAMACGTPVILGDLPQLREWVVDGRNGYLVPPRSAEQLAQRLLSVLSGHDGNLPHFVAYNLRLVREHFRSSCCIPRIKALVRALAGKEKSI